MNAAGTTSTSTTKVPPAAIAATMHTTNTTSTAVGALAAPAHKHGKHLTRVHAEPGLRAEARCIRGATSTTDAKQRVADLHETARTAL